MSQDPTRDHGLLAAGDASDRLRTVIISDTHLAGGPDDVREDHVWRGTPLARFIDQLSDSEDGREGEVELIINGDFLEFVQAAPEMYDSPDTEFWCSEAESLGKLEVILAGHPETFAAMKRFQEAGNALTVMAGNHDIDFYWPSIRRRLRQVAGPVRFELGAEWYGRYGDRLKIAHGHQLDPANRFETWDDPISFVEGQARLESCSGTRFVVGFINRIDARYPFVDNIKPELRLARVLRREDLGGLWWALRMLAGFLRRDGGALLSADGREDSSPRRILEAITADDVFASALLPIYQQVVDECADIESMRQGLETQQDLESFLEKALVSDHWTDLPALPESATLGVSSSGGAPSGGGASTLGLAKERMTDVVGELQAAARKQAREGAQVVVCGHTHVPDELRRRKYVYFNTGSWTRYLNLGDEDTVTLDELKDAERFPYQLWAVHVREGDDDRLEAERVLFEQG